MGHLPHRDRPVKLPVLALLALTAACGASAQAVYKSIGPDGKVIFTDRPPAAGDVPIMGKPVAPAPKEAPAPQAAPAPPTTEPARTLNEEWREKKANAKRGTRVAPPAPPQEPAPAISSEALQAGVHKLMVAEYLINHFRSLCATGDAGGRNSQAATQWRNDHQRLLQDYRVILREAFSPVEQGKIHAQVESAARAQLKDVSSASPAARAKWCASNAEDLNKGVIDLNRDPTVGPVLLAYRRSR
jgi:hypothetical protein